MSKIRIVLVDDHTLVREGFARMLELVPDFEVAGQAANAPEALRLVREILPDIVLMDIKLPGTSGIELTTAVKEISPETEVIILSMYEEEEYIVAAVQAGATGYILKDISPEELVRTIEVVHSGGSLIQPGLARKLLKRVASPSASKAPEGKKGTPRELSEREMEILQLVAEGRSNKEIGEILVISDKTVKAHLRSIFRKLEVGDRAEAVAHAMRKGWVE